MIPFIPAAQAQELPDFVVKAVAQVSAYDDASFTDEHLLTQGSGVFVDHGGCLYTNTHVVLDLPSNDPLPHIGVNITLNRGYSPEFFFEAEVIYADQSVDLAYLCPKHRIDVFTHFFERKKEPGFDQTQFGQHVWVMGYPAAGAGTITISPGNVVGFIDEPDTSKWLGVPDLKPEYLRLYKTDNLAGPGISGGLLVNQDLELIGVPFAGSFLPGAFVFVLSEDVYLTFERNLRIYLHEQGLVPPDCVYDKETDYYYQAGLAFYDNQCTQAFDEFMEHEVKSTYQAFCKEEISSQRLVAAIRRSKQLGDLSEWSDNLILICPPELNPSAQQPVLSSGDFAYGKDRLSSLEQEQALAAELKAEIDANFPQLQIHEDDWSTVVNSYIYGEYPLEAINRAIELGGYTVHPSIPFSLWQGSKDYQENI